MKRRVVRWKPALPSEIGCNLTGFCYTEHGHKRAAERSVPEARIKLTLEEPSRWSQCGKNRYEFQRQFGDERLRVVAKVTAAGWVNVISVVYMSGWQIFDAFRVGIR